MQNKIYKTKNPERWLKVNILADKPHRKQYQKESLNWWCAKGTMFGENGWESPFTFHARVSEMGQLWKPTIFRLTHKAGYVECVATDNAILIQTLGDFEKDFSGILMQMFNDYAGDESAYKFGQGEKEEEQSKLIYEPPADKRFAPNA